MTKIQCDKLLKIIDILIENANKAKQGDAFLLKYALEDLASDLNWLSIPSQDNIKFCNVIKYIAEDGFNISDFRYDEHPIDSIFCFCNSDMTQFFDICLDEQNNAFSAYINAEREEIKAENIADAIKNFVPLE